jgi:hypothetical protein
LKEEYPSQVEFVAGDLGDFSVCIFHKSIFIFLVGNTWPET